MPIISWGVAGQVRPSLIGLAAHTPAPAQRIQVWGGVCAASDQLWPGLPTTRADPMHPGRPNAASCFVRANLLPTVPVDPVHCLKWFLHVFSKRNQIPCCCLNTCDILDLCIIIFWIFLYAMLVFKSWWPAQYERVWYMASKHRRRIHENEGKKKNSEWNRYNLTVQVLASPRLQFCIVRATFERMHSLFC